MLAYLVSHGGQPTEPLVLFKLLVRNELQTIDSLIAAVFQFDAFVCACVVHGVDFGGFDDLRDFGNLNK